LTSDSKQADSPRIDRLKPGEAHAFEGLLRIYREAIPQSERKTDDTLNGMLQRSDYEFQVARSGDDVVGFSIVKCFSDTDACLLEYMAVDRPLRGRGIGREVFRAAADSALTAARYVLIEVDSDTRSAPDRAIRTRRKAFYRALGCREVAGLSYLMPSVTGQRPPEMNLLVYRLRLGATLEKARLRQWLRSIYAEVYQKSADDARIELMVSTLPDSIELQ
jgi:ribosomal protein S18 acetylase RimI-like enzyme